MVLLHGFPEFSNGWKQQIPYLASAGYRVWAPDQRGNNLSDKLDGLVSYSLDELAADVVGLIDAAGQKRIFLVGHDRGAGVAWWVAQISRSFVKNGGHKCPARCRHAKAFTR